MLAVLSEAEVNWKRELLHRSLKIGINERKLTSACFLGSEALASNFITAGNL